MEQEFIELFAVPRLSSGRRLSLYNQLEEAARQRQLIAILPYIERARRHDQTTRHLDDRWASPERRTLYPRGLKQTDAVADVVLGELRDVGQAHISDLDPDDPLRDRIEAMLNTMFPAGLAAVTTLPFVDQVAAMENILISLGGEFAPVVRELALDRKVARLTEITAEYREAVDQMSGPLDFATVKAARDRGHAYMLEIIAMIVGIFHDSDNPEHVENRKAMLAPVIEHSNIVRALRRQARNRADAGDGGDPDDPDLDDRDDDSLDAGDASDGPLDEPTADSDVATAASS